MGTIYTVTDSAGLYEALAEAKGGDEIRLASGDYGAFNFFAWSGKKVEFSSPVTITSLDTNARASFNKVHLDGVKNLSFESILVDYKYQDGDQLGASAFQIANSKNIIVRDVLFKGDLANNGNAEDDGFGFGVGLSVRWSKDINVENNTFSTWYKGLTVAESSNIRIAGNDIHSTRSDGMGFVEVQDVTIEDNYIHDFVRSPTSRDHVDMIQFWTTGTDEPSRNITIRDNILDTGSGDTTQSIFMRNELVDTGLAGEELFYHNVSITGNVIRNGQAHGISVGATKNLTIHQNTILSLDKRSEDFQSTPAINVTPGSKAVKITQNAVEAIGGVEDSSEVTLKDNVLIQNEDLYRAAHYDDLFVPETVSGPVSEYRILKDSVLDQLDAGAPRLLQADDAGGGTVVNEPQEGFNQIPETVPSEENKHSDSEGTVVNSVPKLEVDDYIADFSELGEKQLWRGAEVSEDGDTLILNNHRDYAYLGTIDEIERTPNIAFSVTFKKADLNEEGMRLVWNHNKIGLSVEGEGLRVHTADDTRSFEQGLRVENLGLNDLEIHTVQLVLDSADDRLQIVLDDKIVYDEVDERDLNFWEVEGRDWGWMLGSNRERAFNGEVYDFSLEGDADFVPIVSEDMIL